MTIGTSLGNHYQDEHHYQARSFTPFPGFHQSDNVEDRRKEFFDPRTDQGNDLAPGVWMQRDNETQGDESSTIARALGSTDLDIGRVKQIDKQIEFETSVWPDPSETSLPTGPGDLPTRKTDQQIRDEASAVRGFDTPLASDEESKFQKWKALMAPKDSGEDYDLRGAFKAGVTPDKETGHWPDTYKKPNHPTFSDQSQYAKDAPDLAGSWNGDQYIPPANK